MNKTGIHTKDFPANTPASSLMEQAEKMIDNTSGHILAESPRALIFRPWSAGLTPKEVKECTSIIIFDRNAELRMEKQSGAEDGWMRCMVEDASEADVFARETHYLLRPDTGVRGKLRHVEYFRPDDSGMLVLHASRLAGIV